MIQTRGSRLRRESRVTETPLRWTSFRPVLDAKQSFLTETEMH
jgi:hypothetical protein